MIEVHFTFVDPCQRDLILTFGLGLFLCVICVAVKWQFILIVCYFEIALMIFTTDKLEGGKMRKRCYNGIWV